MIVEGSSVTYVGDDPTIGVGTTGKVLSTSGDGAHVQWLAGAKTSQIDLVTADELIPYRAARAETTASQIEQSFSTPSMLTIAVRDTYDEQGEQGLLNALDEAGHISTLAAYAEEAVGYVALRVRQDPTFAMVLAHLDDSEAEALLQRVASTLLADMAISEGD